MILIDTSIWIDHLRVGDDGLVGLLNSTQVLIHPFVTGELACGNLSNRTEVLRLLEDLPQTPVVSQNEVLFFIEHNKLTGQGIGFIDAHLLAATALVDGLCIWTRDKRLQLVARALDLAYLPRDSHDEP